MNFGVNPAFITDAMSEIQVKVGTIISPEPTISLKMAKVIKFAEAPELTKTLYFTPSQLDHSDSNFSTFSD